MLLRNPITLWSTWESISGVQNQQSLLQTLDQRGRLIFSHVTSTYWWQDILRSTFLNHSDSITAHISKRNRQSNYLSAGNVNLIVTHSFVDAVSRRVIRAQLFCAQWDPRYYRAVGVPSALGLTARWLNTCFAIIYHSAVPICLTISLSMLFSVIQVL